MTGRTSRTAIDGRARVGGEARVWRPVWAWLRLDLRRRWLSLLTLALLVALATGVVMTAAAGARRGASALDRILAVTSPATVAPVPNEPGFDWDAVRRLPDVEAMGTFLLTGLVAVEGHPEVSASFAPMDADIWETVERPVAISGRLADPTRADEAVVSQHFLKTTGLRVGDTVTMMLPTPEQADAAAAGDGEITSYQGPRARLTIVGVVRSGWYFREESGDAGNIALTFGFTEAFRKNLVGATGDAAISNAMIRLRGGAAGIPAFQAELDKVAGHPVETLNVVADERSVRATTSFEAAGLAAFALAAYLAAVVLVGQAVIRFVIGATADLGVLRTLGLTVRQATIAAAAGPVLASAAGVLVGAAAAVAASPLFPIGSAAYVEPDPGRHIDGPVILAVAALTLLLVAVAAATTAFAASVRGVVRPSRPRGSAIARLAYRVGLPVPVRTGARFALETGAAGASVRPALVGAVVGVLGVLGSLTFQTGVADAAANPARFGQNFAVGSFVGFGGHDTARASGLVRVAAADPDVRVVNDTRVNVATVGNLSVTLFSLDPAVGTTPSIQLLEGRLPATPGEIALAPGVASGVGASVGDLLTVAGERPAIRMPMRLTGLTFVPEDPHTDYNHGGWVGAGGYRALFPSGGFKYHEVMIETRPGADVSAVRDRLNKAAGSDETFFLRRDVFKVEEQERFHNVAVLPRLLGAFLGVLAVGAVGHALFVGVRRRRHEVAVLRALGMTRWQARVIVLTQAALIGSIGLAVGVPLGMLLGRALWRAIATSTPLVYVPPVAALALALVLPVTVLATGLLASVPARRAARLRVPDILRAE